MPRILLVDDSAAILSNLSEYLELKGWESESASCAFDAERLMHKGAFDAVVLDIGLPDKDGLTLCSEWRARGVSTPILFLTARDTVDERVEGLETGGDDYLSKPFALRVDLLIGYFGSRHRLDEFFNRLPEKINPFSVQKHIIRPSD